MNEASTLLQLAPTADAQQELRTIRVSRASAKHNRVLGDCELGEIIEQIRTGSGGVRPKIEPVREKFRQVMDATNGDRKAAKDAVHDLKLGLPAVMPSGTFTRRSDKALSQHSGLVCIDSDGLGREKLAEVKAKLRESLFLYAQTRYQWVG